MGLARSTFYDDPETQPTGAARLVEQIKAVCAEWPAYSYRRVTAELHGGGRIVNHKKVMRLMKENGLTVRQGGPAKQMVAGWTAQHGWSLPWLSDRAADEPNPPPPSAERDPALRPSGRPAKLLGEHRAGRLRAPK